MGYRKMCTAAVVKRTFRMQWFWGSSVKCWVKLGQNCKRQNYTNYESCRHLATAQRQAQLSQRDRAMLRIIDYFAKSLKVTQGH